MALRVFGTAGWARTNDLRIHNPALYQLSYSCTLFSARNLGFLAGRFKRISAAANRETGRRQGAGADSRTATQTAPLAWRAGPSIAKASARLRPL